VGLSWLARNGRTGVPGVASPGEESLTAAIAARRSRHSRPAARSSHQEAARVARPTASVGEDVAHTARARGQAQWAKEQKRWSTKRPSQLSRTKHDTRVADTSLSAAGIAAVRLKRREDRALVTVRPGDAASARHPIGEMTRRDLSYPWPRTPRRAEI
jgi:hypothetical protein